MLTLEVNEDAQTVELYFDSEGLGLLMRRLQLLRDKPGHDHLMTSSWAGTELDETPQGNGTTLKHHLVLIRVADGLGDG